MQLRLDEPEQRGTDGPNPSSGILHVLLCVPPPQVTEQADQSDQVPLPLLTVKLSEQEVPLVPELLFGVAVQVCVPLCPEEKLTSAYTELVGGTGASVCGPTLLIPEQLQSYFAALVNDAVILLLDGAVIDPEGFQDMEHDGVATELTGKVSKHVTAFSAEFLNAMLQVSVPAELKVYGPAEPPLIVGRSVSNNGIGPLQEIRAELAFLELQYKVDCSPTLMLDLSK